MPTLRVAIAGATGYAGEELIRLLRQHPSVQLTYLAASAKWDRATPVSAIYPRVGHRLNCSIESLDVTRLIDACDMAFLALPHGAAAAIVPALLAAGKRVIDLSGDFRLRDPAAYPAWYRFTHPHPELLTDARVVYGLTEFHGGELPQARLVSNPGCYATGILLACLPLFRARVVTHPVLIVDAKSGLTGAGRKADPTLLYAEVAENLRAYKVNQHQHMPEILQEIAQVTGQAPRMVFVPQVIPVARGLISMLYVNVTSEQAVHEAYRAAYASDAAPFIRLRPGMLPQLRDVAETNYCDIGWVHDASTGTMVVASALDNLTKGAAGQAIQNLNSMMGWNETTGLL